MDQKVYAVIWNLVDLNYHGLIITTKSGMEAWVKLITEYQKGHSNKNEYSTI